MAFPVFGCFQLPEVAHMSLVLPDLAPLRPSGQGFWLAPVLEGPPLKARCKATSNAVLRSLELPVLLALAVRFLHVT